MLRERQDQNSSLEGPLAAGDGGLEWLMSRGGAAKEAGPEEEVNVVVPWTSVTAVEIQIVALKASWEVN